MTALKITLIGLIILSSAILPANANRSKTIVRGDCGRRSCKAILKELRQLYPNYIFEYEQKCRSPQILGLDIGYDRQNSQQIWLFCWNAKIEKGTKGTRYGVFLGTLPLKGMEAKFLTPLPSDSPYTAELLQRYPQDVKKAQFKCATKGGALNISSSDSSINVELQCYFQAGSTPVDLNRDFKSDGEDSRGASVDEIVGTFPVSDSLEIR